MINFDDVGKVTNVICKPTPNLTLKHVIRIKREAQKEVKLFGPPKRGNMLNYAFPYTKPDGSEPGMYFQQGDTFLELETKRQVLAKDVKTNKIQSQVIRLTCTFRDIPILINVLEKAYMWLTNNSNDIFVRDAEGRPLKVCDPLLQVLCPLKNGTVAFKPCIIRDIQDVRYEGIAMVSPKDGELTNFTGPEFSMFKMAIIGFGNNYYLSNQLLINQTMSYCMYNNLMEVLNKNGKQSSKPQQ